MAPWKIRKGWWERRDPAVGRVVLLSRLKELVGRDSPRLLMTVMVVGTGAAGLFASVLLRELGVLRMWLRYGMAVAIAYGAFMFFVWLWLQWKRRRYVEDPGWDAGDAHDDPDPDPDPDPHPIHVIDRPAADPAPDPYVESDGAPSGSIGVGGGGGWDIDDGVVWIPVVLAIAAAVISSVYVIVIAPELLAELLLDGVLATALYRRLRRIDSRHWLESAISRTWIPMLITAVFFVIAGAVCHWYAPEATSLGDVWRYWSASRGR